MNLYKYVHQTGEGELIRCLFIDVWKYRVLIALAQTNWETSGKPRRIPVYASKNGLMIYRFAIRFGVRK